MRKWPKIAPVSTIDPRTLTVPPPREPAPSPPPPKGDPTETGKGGEGGKGPRVTNADFIKALFPRLLEGASAAVCSKPGDPIEGGWVALRAERAAGQLLADRNNYVCSSSFFPCDDGSFSVRKTQFAALHFLLLDDLGTKCSLERLADFELSWLIETSPGNFQGGIILADPVADRGEAERLLKALIAAGLCDGGAAGLNRWARLPNAINGKEKYRMVGAPFRCRLVDWRPERRYTQQEIVTGLRLEVPENRQAGAPQPFDHLEDDPVVTPRAAENPVVAALKARGLYKTPLGSGKHDMTCPWVHEHTDALDTGAAYFEPDENFPIGGFVCLHSHREKYKIKQLLDFLGIKFVEAMHQAVIRIVGGNLHRIVDAAERELARRGRHFQAGGLIVSVTTDPATGDPSIVAANTSSLIREFSAAVIWEKYDGRTKDWVRCDPPPRHISILYDSKSFRHLSPLAGLARQPYFRESDGQLVTQSGYDPVSKLFGVFDPRQFVVPDPTPEAARSALALLEDLLAEFHFVSDADRSAALSAMVTSAVRPTLPHAPAYHVRAPVPGSGKTYLCEVIGAFASPAGNAKVSYPKTSEEATKVLLSLLLANPAVIEFDDMDSDWLPHGTINRALTSEHVTDRILGVSKTATVSTRTLFLGSGNNVGPIRDLLRRVLTIHLDPRCATPATISYKNSPLQKVRQDRGKYVAAVLIIILAWIRAGSPIAEVESIVSYDGRWSEFCRYPLIWLGRADPATALLRQVKHDPDAEALGGLMAEWRRLFGSKTVALRKVLEEAEYDDALMDAIREFPVEEKGIINRSKLGWVLKKNANRIINGLVFRRGEADGRTAWRVADADFHLPGDVS